MAEIIPGSAAKHYEILSTDRRQYDDRARDIAQLTIPSLYPPEGFSGSERLYTPFQSVGQRGVIHLANKLVMTTLPANSPFFRLVLGGEARKELNQIEDDQERDTRKAELDKGFQEIETEVHSFIERKGIRGPVVEVMKHLLVSGNTLLYAPEDGKSRMYPLTSYVVKRTSDGMPCLIIIKEKFLKSELSEEMKEAMASAPLLEQEKGKVGNSQSDSVDLYTVIERNDKGAYTEWQEIDGTPVSDSFSVYPSYNAMPYYALRVIRVDGENYGRSYIEDGILGDLKSLEGLWQSLVEASAVMSRIITLIKPGAALTTKTLSEALNGSVLVGDPDDVGTVQSDKYADLQAMLQAIERIERRLNQAFLLNTSVQRDAERVTAEEIRFVAQELEAGLGGVYGLLQQDFQAKLADWAMMVLKRKGILPKLSDDLVRPIIITGVEALGRGQDLNKLRSFITDITNAAQNSPDISRKVNWKEVVQRLAISHGLSDVDALLVSDQTLEMQDAQAQVQALLERAAPNLVNGMAGDSLPPQE